ncbi:MAG: DUF262 domain-containing protein [Magnetococcales bacterium]|nr:DUF262 domain-containing protein [Magnetococcales bacterium]MBF0116708.1 DUF262 domain-containing protein [Magnetococcales bacterium]
MAKTILLNTRTATFLDIVGNGKVYTVPPYQRDYSWTEEQWEDLWNDIIEMQQKPDSDHYMGSLVLEGHSDREFQIIDGQQRLATLSVLALAVLNRLEALVTASVEREENKERSIALRNRFIGEKDPASLVEKSKLVLNETDNGFYQDYLVQGRTPVNIRRLPYSNQMLWKAFCFFVDRLSKENTLQESGLKLAQLLSETIARQLQFILITVDDTLNAYTVFETLNARGLALSSTDLLKNYLFSKIRVKGDLESLQRRWSSLIEVVRQEKFPDFLRYHLLCTHKQVRKPRLFKMVRELVHAPQDVFDLMDRLESRAELYAAVFDEQHAYWQDRPECRPYIEALKLFDVQQMMPLVFSAWETCDRGEFVAILRMVSIISFRFTVVCKRNSNALESVYPYAASHLLHDGKRNPEAVFAHLRPVYVPDKQFEQDFALLTLSTAGSRKKLVKYILSELESVQSGRHCDHRTDPATIEHILPENPMQEWGEMFAESGWQENRYRIGNMTLLESAANRQIGNRPYQEKRSLYQQSAYALSRELASMAPEEWTVRLLEKRQAELAKRAVHCWRLSYGESS